MPPDPSVPLSVVVATQTPWPQLERCLAAIVDQARRVGAEVVVADGGGRALPEPRTPPLDEVVWLRAPGNGAFRLRSLAVARARGDVIAITEDHCEVQPDWCERILAAHAEHPEAAAIGGAVENGATCHLADWASFFIANGPFIAPLRNGETDRISLQANISYKRQALEGADLRGLGLMEMLLNQALRRRAQTLVADDRIVVNHVQCVSSATFCALHFHNGRSIAGFRLARIGVVERIVRLGGCTILPPVMLLRTLWTTFRKRRLAGRVLASVPWMLVLLSCHAAGEFLGYLNGPGTSPTYKYIG